MSTLLAVFDSSGQCIARCDIRCYAAQGDDCNCICQGRHHKRGIQAARSMASTTLAELTPDQIDAFLVGNGHGMLQSQNVSVHRGGRPRAKAAQKQRTPVSPEDKAKQTAAQREQNEQRASLFADFIERR